MTIKLGIDVGGTFTDIVAVLPDGQRRFRKVPSTPQDQSIGVAEGISRMLDDLGMGPGDVAEVVHGTTVATNTMLERNGARTALVTTRGFRDVIHIGRQSRPHLYDLYAQRMDPLVPRELRREVTERMDFRGQVVTPLDEGEVATLAGELVAEGIEAVAIAFLHSYANDSHERRAKEIFAEVAPQLLVSTSAEILPEFREFERFNTTVINSYVRPGMQRYVSRLAERIQGLGIAAPLLIMQSSGGMMTDAVAAERSVQTLLSGPAGGVLATQYLAELTETKNYITADLGGTSFDVAVVEDGELAMATEGEIEGFPVKFPHIDITTIGAGGGSIAWLDAGGALRVGPRSAGAVPGPVCYSKGGTEPTVTDANAVLGRLSPALSGGELSLDVDAARDAIRTRIAEPLGLGVEDAAEGILRVVNANMVRAIRVMTIERGVDPRHFALLPFGGAGALHGSELGRTLGLSHVVVPVAPGNFSALGLLVAPVRYDLVQSLQVRDDDLEAGAVERAYAALEEKVRAQLAADEIESDEVTVQRRADLRYVGQAFELSVPVPDGPLTAADLSEVITQFHGSHERHYGFQKPGEPVELVILRVSLLAAAAGTRSMAAIPAAEGDAAPTTTRPAYFAGSWVDTPLYDRETLRAGHSFAGPAIVQESGSTTVVSPGDRVTVDQFGNLVLTMEA